MASKEDKPQAKGRRLGTCLVAAALTAALVPLTGLAENLFASDETAVEAQAETNEAIAVESVTDGETAASPKDACDTAADSASADAPADDAEEAKNAEPEEDREAPAVAYKKYDWNGTQVSVTRESGEDAKPLPDNGKLEGGVYLLDADRSFGDRMVVTADTDLVLGDDCTLTAKAGIHVQKGATLTICAQDGKGNGRLVANAKTGAGIGAYSKHRGGDVVICGGDVQAHGGKHCAGIGSNDGDRTEVGSVTIFDGTVDATGGESGAGIGGGRASEGGHVSIHGGTVTAQGGHYAAGIGGGNGQGHPVKGAHAGTIEIWGGNVNATGGDDAAGIGGGEGGNAGSISIHVGNVTAQGGNNGAGIGCGEGEADDSNGGTITIDGGTVNAYAGNFGAGIGGGHDSRCDSIDISCGNVHAFANKTSTGKECTNGAGIGGGSDADGGTINISGGVVEAVASNDGAGIGGGDHGDGGTVTISGGDVTATAGGNGAGIGGGQHSGSGGTVTISGGDVTASSQRGAAIGGGRGWIKSVYLGMSEEFIESGDGGTISITGGNVTATSTHAFGIGAGMGGAKSVGLFSSGELGSAGTITVDGDATVTARGALAGMGGDEGSIAIKGGDVTARGIEGVSGYGIYFADDEGTLDMSGGTLTASGDSGNGTNEGSWRAYAGIAVRSGNTVNITGGEVHATASSCPAIGSTSGGSSDSPTDVDGDGTLNVSGKDTHVYATSSASWGIGSKDGKVKVNVRDGATLVCSSEARKALGTKKLSLYDEARVRAGAREDSAETCPAAQRTSAALAGANHYVAIEPCEHADFTYETVDDCTHTATCPYCGSTFDEEHSPDADGHCTKCTQTDIVTAPAADHVELLPDGRIGLRLYMTPPKVGRSSWQNGSMEFKFAGKGNMTFEVPLDLEKADEDGTAYYFDCPVGTVQMADRITATYRVGERRTAIMEGTLVEELVNADERDAGLGNRTDGLVRALSDYGHYTQKYLSKELHWKLGSGENHEVIPAATLFSDKTVADAREDLDGLPACTARKGDTVSRITTRARLGSETALDLSFETKEELVSVTVDGMGVPRESVRRIDNSWVVTIDGIRAGQLADGHDVKIETTGTGNTTASISGVSPLIYARAVLDSSDPSTGVDAQRAMCALYHYYLVVAGE